MNKLFIIFLFFAVVLTGCVRTQPQRPTYHGHAPAEDTTLIQSVTFNQQMAEKADAQLIGYADGYTLTEDSYWVRGLKPTDTPLTDGETVKMHALFYRLDSTLLTDHTADATLGRIDEIPAIMSVIPQMNRGDSISLLVPWYLAFGSTGNGVVPPYENIRIELTIK